MPVMPSDHAATSTWGTVERGVDAVEVGVRRDVRRQAGDRRDRPAPAAGIGVDVSGCGSTVLAAGGVDDVARRAVRRPSTAAAGGHGGERAGADEEHPPRRRGSPADGGVAGGRGSTPARRSSTNSVPMPAAAARTAATTPVAASPSGSSRYEQQADERRTRRTRRRRPTGGAPTPCRARRRGRATRRRCRRRGRPCRSCRTGRSARSLSEAAKRSMNCVPTAEISDGPEPARPHTSSLTPSATPAATTPASAPWAALTVGLGRSAWRSVGVPGSWASVATAMATTVRPRPGRRASRDAKRTRNSRRRRPALAGARRTVAAVAIATERPAPRACSSSTTSRWSGRSSPRTCSATACGSTRRPTARARWRGWPAHRPDLVVLDIMLPGHRRPDDPAPAAGRGRDPRDPADGPRRRGRPGARAWSSAPTTTSSSRSRPASWRRGCAPCCGAARRRAGDGGDGARVRRRCASTRSPARSTSTAGRSC